MFIYASVATAWCKLCLSPSFTTRNRKRSPHQNENQGISLLLQLQAEFVKWQRIRAWVMGHHERFTEFVQRQEFRRNRSQRWGLVHGSVGKSSCWNLALPKAAHGMAELLLCGTGQGEVSAKDKHLNGRKPENLTSVGKGLRVSR